MKKLYFLLLLITGLVNAQIVNIPDANFKARLLAAAPGNQIASIATANIIGQVTTYNSIDINGDGQIQVSEAALIKYLNVGGYSITNLNGISSFVNLKNLSCGVNQLTSLDLSSNTALTWLDCHSNQLTSLNVSNNTALRTLYCFTNQLTSLNMSNNSALTLLDCSVNQLTALNVSSNTALIELRCYSNQLTSLDLSSNTMLTILSCNYNQLINLFMKNGSDETNLGFSNNPNLLYICADDTQLADVQTKINIYGYTSTCSVSSYCAFTPGGNYNTISGTVTFDANNNGCDVTDTPQPNIRVNMTQWGINSATFSNSNGNYTFYTTFADQSVTPQFENSTYFNVSPQDASISFANNNNNTATQNFCITANGVHPDLEVVIAPITPARPGFDAQYKVVFKNKGNQTLSGNVTFSYDDAVLDFIISTVITTSQSTGSLNYDYTNLLPFENRSFYITLHANAPTDSTPLNIGDQLSFTATVNPIAGDEFPSDNTFQYNQTVVGSYDPNDITCMEGNIVPPAEIGNYLHYIINFENTGTADAENIVVRDVIDTTQFDVNSLQILNSSAEVTAKLTGNVAEFIFQNINLHSGGHGNILIKIKSKNTLVQGETVSKRANIYFDYNTPIDTNQENTTFQALSNPDFEADASISVYPNPTKGNVNISSNNNIHSVQLYDVQGRLLQTSLVNENQTTIDISNQSNGVYFLKIVSDKGLKVQKIVRE